MKNVRIVLIVLSVALVCSFAGGNLQAKDRGEFNKEMWNKIELQNCSIVALNYLAAAEDGQAALNDGYTLGPPLPFLPEGTVAVLVHIIDCENFRLGDTLDVGGGTVFHEIMLGGVISPEGEYLHWTFPYTVTNPMVRAAFRSSGARSHPARDLSAEVELDFDQGMGAASAYVDNIAEYGPDLFVTLEGPMRQGNTWVADSPLKEYSAWGKKHRGVTWTAVEDRIWYGIEGDPVLEIEGDFTLPVLEMHAFPPFAGTPIVVMTGLDAIVAAIE